MAELYIIPECYVDTNLLETLVPTAKGYNHQKGCNNVVKVMKEKLADEFAVGIVDKDKGKFVMWMNLKRWGILILCFFINILTKLIIWS